MRLSERKIVTYYVVTFLLLHLFLCHSVHLFVVSLAQYGPTHSPTGYKGVCGFVTPSYNCIAAEYITEEALYSVLLNVVNFILQTLDPKARYNLRVIERLFHRYPYLRSIQTLQTKARLLRTRTEKHDWWQTNWEHLLHEYLPTLLDAHVAMLSFYAGHFAREKWAARPNEAPLLTHSSPRLVSFSLIGLRIVGCSAY